MDRLVQQASLQRRWILVALAAQVALVVGMLHVNGLFHHVGMDFLTSYTAAEMVAGGDASRLYDTRAQWEHQRPIIQRYDVEWPDRVMHPYVAPPLLAVATIPFLLLTPAVAAVIWSALNALAVALALLILCRRLRLDGPDAAVLLVGSLPLFYVLMLGQVEGFLLLAMALFMTELRAGRDVRAGLALAVFAIKAPLLLAPLVYLFVLGRRRAIWTTIAAGALQAVVSAAIVGREGVAGYLELSHRLAGPDGTVVTNVWGMVNIRAMVVRAFPADDGLLVNVVIIGLTALILAGAAWLWWRAAAPTGPTALALLATTTVLTSYHALYHTTVIALLGGVLLVASARHAGDTLRMARVVVVSWVFFSALPLAYYVVIQSSKVPAAISTIGVLLICGMAAQSLAQPASQPAPQPAEFRNRADTVRRPRQATWGD